MASIGWLTSTSCWDIDGHQTDDEVVKRTVLHIPSPNGGVGVTKPNVTLSEFVVLRLTKKIEVEQP